MSVQYLHVDIAITTLLNNILDISKYIYCRVYFIMYTFYIYIYVFIFDICIVYKDVDFD